MDVSLVPDPSDPRTVFRLHSVLKVIYIKFRIVLINVLYMLCFQQIEHTFMSPKNLLNQTREHNVVQKLLQLYKNVVIASWSAAVVKTFMTITWQVKVPRVIMWLNTDM